MTEINQTLYKPVSRWQHLTMLKSPTTSSTNSHGLIVSEGKPESSSRTQYEASGSSTGSVIGYDHQGITESDVTSHKTVAQAEEDTDDEASI